MKTPFPTWLRLSGFAEEADSLVFLGSVSRFENFAGAPNAQHIRQCKLAIPSQFCNLRAKAIRNGGYAAIQIVICQKIALIGCHRLQWLFEEKAGRSVSRDGSMIEVHGSSEEVLILFYPGSAALGDFPVSL